MGPDEFATRQELNLVFKLLFAKIQQQNQFISAVAGAVRANGVITDSEFQELLRFVAESPDAAKVRLADEKLREFLTIRNIVREYLDPLEE